MHEQLRAELAGPSDAEEIYALYHSLINLPYSTWDENYPTREMVEADVAASEVLVLRGEDGRIVSAIVVAQEEGLAGAAAWYENVARWAGFARLGVASDMQGRGIARRMLREAMAHARALGYEAVRFLVAVSNPIAQRSYAKLDFDICGEVEKYEHRWLCYQKRL